MIHGLTCVRLVRVGKRISSGDFGVPKGFDLEPDCRVAETDQNLKRSNGTRSLSEPQNRIGPSHS
jgi:hypothetical protein